MAALTTLPNELLDHILSHLSTDPPPSSRNFRELPSHSLTASSDAPLKNISRVDKRCRALSLPRVFAHSRYELRYQTQFLDFLRQNDLGRHVKTVVVSVRTVYRGTETPRWWKELLHELDPLSVTVIAPPYIFADMADTTLYQKDGWAFNLPLQMMQFRQPAWDKPHPRVLEPNEHDTFLNARPWTALSFNEGSSLSAYSTYEYFLLRVPSLMDTWGQSLSSPPATPQSAITPFIALARLTSFHYTAIFPFYNHTNLVLKLLRTMTSLRSFALQLSPGPGSTILDEESARSSALDANDPWMELETSYALVAHTVKYLGVQGPLQEFQTLDYAAHILREIIDRKLGRVLSEKWAHDGEGFWKKRPVSASVNSQDGDAG